MGLSFDDKLINYANLGLSYGLGFDQKVRPLYVESYQTEDLGHFIPILARVAYALGVETIDVCYRYPELDRAMFDAAPEELKTYVPAWIGTRAQEIVNRDGGRLALNGNGELGVMDNVAPNLPSALHSALFKANEPLTTRRMKMLQPWSILDVPTIAWAKKLGMSTHDLWEFLFTITGADRSDSIGYAIDVSDTLHRRCSLLNDLQIQTLHFVGGRADLKVGLSPRARWLGGRKQAEDGTWFGPNWPSFEIFTTPDWSMTEGYVGITMPSVLDGPIVDGLEMSFSKGRIVDFMAVQGTDAFRALIGHDIGAAQLGEIALVGLDAPLSSYEDSHFCTLLDENKRCHAAVGVAYAAALEGGHRASDEELAALGCNKSDVHHDMMISDETTSVFALDAGGRRLAQLMQDGRWIEPFA